MLVVLQVAEIIHPEEDLEEDSQLAVVVLEVEVEAEASNIQWIYDNT